MKVDLKEIPVYYINLDRHPQKRKSTEDVLNILGFKNINRVAGVPHENSRLGCTLAHMEALKAGLSGVSPFLIVEDDILIKNKNTVFDIPDAVDALYLGVSRWGMYKGKGDRKMYIEKHDDNL